MLRTFYTAIEKLYSKAKPVKTFYGET